MDFLCRLIRYLVLECKHNYNKKIQELFSSKQTHWHVSWCCRGRIKRNVLVSSLAFPSSFFIRLVYVSFPEPWTNDKNARAENHSNVACLKLSLYASAKSPRRLDKICDIVCIELTVFRFWPPFYSYESAHVQLPGMICCFSDFPMLYWSIPRSTASH